MSNEPNNMDLESLYAAYADMVYRLALLRTRSRADAEDVTQEVFFRCLRRQPVFLSAEHQKAWLLTVTIHCSANLLTTAFRRHTVGEESLAGQAAQEGSDPWVWALVASLPEKYKTAVHLHYYEGYSVAEIARMCKTTESTVKSWLRRARLKLKEQLTEDF
ncbi:MAG: RNA polymerase sigma factor [Clostridiales bacterium]|nr:RNA polymerase sigma factor [Clostridiales bacterium]